MKTGQTQNTVKTVAKVGAVVAVASMLLFAAGCTTALEPTTEWSGCYPAVYKDSIDMYGYGPDGAWLPDLEIGFRSDGVIVWRKSKK